MKHLARTRQCATCPWKKTTDPHDIPNGYSETRHRRLKNTIADRDNPQEQIRAALDADATLRLMACHYSRTDDQQPCIGWLHNQLGPGNNIALRMSMMKCDNAGEISIDGPQHETFEQTLPKRRRKTGRAATDEHD